MGGGFKAAALLHASTSNRSKATVRCALNELGAELRPAIAAIVSVSERLKKQKQRATA